MIHFKNALITPGTMVGTIRLFLDLYFICFASPTIAGFTIMTGFIFGFYMVNENGLKYRAYSHA
jgi:hypothetical protein